MSTVQASINFNNYSVEGITSANNGKQSEGICIYNQKYTIAQALPAEMSKTQILEHLNKYITIKGTSNEDTNKYGLNGITEGNSGTIASFQKCLGGGENDNTEELLKDL